MRNKQDEDLTILRFNIKTTKKQDAILEKVTARHTFAIKRYLTILDNDEFPYHGTEGELDQFTIKTKNRDEVKYDLIAETGLSSTDLQSAGRTAIRTWKTYLTQHKNWERRRDSAARTSIMRFQSTMEISSKGEVIYPASDLIKAVEGFTKTRVWKRVRKSEPSKPLQSKYYKAKKIPMRLVMKNNLLTFMINREIHSHKIEHGRLFIKLKTLIPHQTLKLELVCSQYHMKEIENGRITGGKIIKNLKKKRWEFHAYVRREKLFLKSERKKGKAVLSIDLGINNIATMTVLLENSKLKRKQFYFFNEWHLRKRLLNIFLRRKELHKIVFKERGLKRKNALKELRGQKYSIISNELCHRIATKIASVAQEYFEEDYEVHVAIGRLKGMITVVRKGSGISRGLMGIYHRFPYAKLTEFIKYKCERVGVSEKNIQLVSEHSTSKTCHKCESKNTVRPTQKQFVCLDCNCQYNADANASINIGLRYLKKITNTKRQILKLRYIQGSQEPTHSSNLLEYQGTNDTPLCDELTGDNVELSQVKVKKAEKVILQ